MNTSVMDKPRPRELNVIRHQLDWLVEQRYSAACFSSEEKVEYQRLATREKELLGQR
jgi:hypothetical protein